MDDSDIVTNDLKDYLKKNQLSFQRVTDKIVDSMANFFCDAYLLEEKSNPIFAKLNFTHEENF